MGIDDNETSPFIVACSQGHIGVLNWLLSHGMPASELTHAGNICLFAEGVVLAFFMLRRYGMVAKISINFHFKYIF